MFLREGVGGHGRVHIIYIRAREKGRKGTRSLFYLPYPLKEHSTPPIPPLSGESDSDGEEELR